MFYNVSSSDGLNTAFFCLHPINQSTHLSIPGPSFPLFERKGRKGEMQLIE
jgi:hypothetical protein